MANCLAHLLPYTSSVAAKLWLAIVGFLAFLQFARSLLERTRGGKKKSLFSLRNCLVRIHLLNARLLSRKAKRRVKFLMLACAPAK